MEDIGVSNGTFYKLKPKAVEIVRIRALKRQKDLEQAKTSETIQQAKNGLKTKMERLMILQNEVDACIHELELSSKKTPLDVYERVALRKTIKDLQAEISKIEGDYAAEKIEHSETTKPFNDQQVDKLISALRETKAT